MGFRKGPGGDKVEDYLILVLFDSWLVDMFLNWFLLFVFKLVCYLTIVVRHQEL